MLKCQRFNIYEHNNIFKKNQPTLEHFKLCLSQANNVEKYIYFTNDRVAQFDRKCGNLKAIIDN